MAFKHEDRGTGRTSSIKVFLAFMNPTSLFISYKGWHWWPSLNLHRKYTSDLLWVVEEYAQDWQQEHLMHGNPCWCKVVCVTYTDFQEGSQEHSLIIPCGGSFCSRKQYISCMRKPGSWHLRVRELDASLWANAQSIGYIEITMFVPTITPKHEVRGVGRTSSGKAFPACCILMQGDIDDQHWIYRERMSKISFGNWRRCSGLTMRTS